MENMIPFLPFVKKDKQSKEEQRLLAEIRKTEVDIEKASVSFRQAIDPLLIDCYIYELNAAQKRYQYLIQKAKDSGLINASTVPVTPYFPVQEQSLALVSKE